MEGLELTFALHPYALIRMMLTDRCHRICQDCRSLTDERIDKTGDVFTLKFSERFFANCIGAAPDRRATREPNGFRKT